MESCFNYNADLRLSAGRVDPDPGDEDVSVRHEADAVPQPAPVLQAAPGLRLQADTLEAAAREPPRHHLHTAPDDPAPVVSTLYLVQDLLPPVCTHGLAPEQVGTTEVGEHLDPDLQWQPRQASVLVIIDHCIRLKPYAQVTNTT